MELNARKQLSNYLDEELVRLKSEGFYKPERIIASPQAGEIAMSNGAKVLNFCANNYLGLADNRGLIQAAKAALDRYGYGVASVRFICGTQVEHKLLEKKISDFLRMEAAILYSSCFDANAGLFETLFDESDAIISDQLNHASIIDGLRLCKARKLRYSNNDMQDLEGKLREGASFRFRLIVTDGVFSMDGIIANLKEICALADKYDAMVMVDDSHAVGVLGDCGRGTPEHCGVDGRVDIITGTLGKALGGASGGYIAASEKIVEWLRQKSRPYLFSNSLAPAITAASIKAFELIEGSGTLRQTLRHNSLFFRKEMERRGFDLVPGEHPIIPILLGEAKLAQEMAEKMLDAGIYVIGFSYPVVPKGQARIRTQMSAAHSREDVERAIECFGQIGQEMGIV